MSSRENSFDSESDFRANEMGAYPMKDQSKQPLMQALPHSIEKKNELMLFDNNS